MNACLLVVAIVAQQPIPFDPKVPAIPELMDRCDIDGDGVIVDQEYAAVFKSIRAAAKSKKPSPTDSTVLAKMDLDGDDKVSDLEMENCMLLARYHGDKLTQMAVDSMKTWLDKDGDWVVSKKEFFDASASENNFHGRHKFADMNGDGVLTVSELITNVDKGVFERQRAQDHPSLKSPGAWQKATLMIGRLDKAPKDNRISPAEADGEIKKKFDVIDTDKDGKIKLLELYSHIATQ